MRTLSNPSPFALPNAHFHHQPSLPAPTPINPFPLFESQSSLSDRIFVAKGIHPWTVSQLSTVSPQQINYLLGNLFSDSLKTIDAIGEIGLDFAPSRLPSPSTKTLQIEIFKSQYLFAQEHRLPIILHLVKATDTFLQIIKAFPPTPPLLFHQFQGSSQQLLQLLKSSSESTFYFSFSPTKFYPSNPISNKQREAIRTCPIKHLLIEDESLSNPTLENKSLALFYNEIAEIKEISLDFLIQTIAKNIVSFYN